MCVQVEIVLAVFMVIMATPGDGTDPPKQKGGGKDKHNSGTSKPLIPFSELRASVSQLLKKVGCKQAVGARQL